MRRKAARWRNTRGRHQNLRGPNRALSLDEQLEIQRLMREARADRRSTITANRLAKRYGISSRTVYRYTETVPVPPGTEFLRIRLETWARERQIALSLDDLVTLLLVVTRHRDSLRHAA